MADTPLLDDIHAFVRRYVILSEAQALTVSLWVLHTYCTQRLEQTPYLAITSPDKECGKSRLLEVLEILVQRPWRCELPSEAVLYRYVDFREPTLLLDETDAIFNPKTADRYEGHRAILNAGNRRGAPVPRCVGPQQNIMEFDPYCPKALAGIGTLPDTITSRAIPIRMKRARSDERPERFLRRRSGVDAAAKEPRQRIEAWEEQEGQLVAKAEPDMPNELSDRMLEGCEPLVATAERFGVDDQARPGLVELLAVDERLDSTDSMRHRLLKDLRTIFEKLDKEQGPRVRNVSTEALLSRLKGLEEAPWQNFYGRGIEPRDIASLLRPYGVEPRVLKLKTKTRRGYRRDDLEDVWARYLK